MANVELDTGVNLYFEVTGTGPPVLFIAAGSLGSDSYHLHPVDDLSGQFQVITFDPRGIGRSVARDGFLTVKQMAADARALLYHLGINRTHVVGHSLGGRVALSLALTHPRLVQSLTMAASGSGVAIRTGEAVQPFPSPKSIIAPVDQGFEERARHDVFATGNWLPAEFREKSPGVVEEFWERTWNNHADLNWELRQRMARAAFEATHRLQDVQVPTLVLVGSADMDGARPHFPASQILADRIPGAELRVLEGLAHGMFWQDPSLVTSVLTDWFDRH